MLGTAWDSMGIRDVSQPGKTSKSSRYLAVTVNAGYATSVAWILFTGSNAP
jgi:hypothetical protein